MSGNGSQMDVDPIRGLPRSVPIRPDAVDVMRRAAAQVMEIQDVTLGHKNMPLRVRGRLIMSPEKAFNQLRPQFEAVGCTPTLRRDEDMDAIMALPFVYGQQARVIPWILIILLVLTILSVFYIGVGWDDNLFLDPGVVILVKLTGNTALVPDPELMPTPDVWQHALRTGALYVLAMLGILGSHEMGHYLMARYHKVQATLPFFIPMPLNILGTLGAVIALREPAPNRRIQFDIGIAGPLAGLIIAVPVMIAGLMLSPVGTAETFMASVPESIRDQMAIMHEGQSLVYLGLKYLVFGQILPRGDVDVWVHPVAFAAWAGLLVTSLNLLPIGQLDGGHVLYGLLGDKAKVVRKPIIAILVVMAAVGTIREMVVGLPAGASMPLFQIIADLPIPGWSGWWIWVGMIVLLMRRHAPVLDELTELDDRRKFLGVVMLIVFILIFTPIPLVIEA